MMNNETMKIMVASLAVTPAADSIQDHVLVLDQRGFGPLTIQAVPEETLVMDERYGLSPSQMVESKLKLDPRAEIVAEQPFALAWRVEG